MKDKWRFLVVIYHHQGNGELLQVPFGEFRNLDILAVLADFPIHARRVLKHPQPSRVVIFIRKLDTRSLWTMCWPGDDEIDPWMAGNTLETASRHDPQISDFQRF